MLTYLLHTILTYLSYLPYLLGGFCKFRLSTTAKETRNDSTVQQSEIPRLIATVRRTSLHGGWLARHSSVVARSSKGRKREAVMLTLHTYIPTLLNYLLGGFYKFRLNTTTKEKRDDYTVRHSEIPRLRVTVRRTTDSDYTVVGDRAFWGGQAVILEVCVVAAPSPIPASISAPHSSANSSFNCSSTP